MQLFVYKVDGKAIRLTSSFPLVLAGEVRSSIWQVLKTIHWLFTLGKGEVHFLGGGNFMHFAGVFFKYLTMPKTKKKDKMKTKAEGSGKSLLVEPSSECKEFVVALIARFYERESTMSLESCYVRYAEEGITKFKMDMTQRVMDALHNDKWMEETQKSGYQKFLDNVVHDSIWNVKNILTKYRKAHRPGNAAFTDVITTTDLFA
jgi:hypothetical protein